LSAQTLDRSRFEVIVCDDGSPAPVAVTLAAELESVRGAIQVEVVRQENGGRGRAQPRGGRARGRFLAFTDDDCRPTPEWLERLLDRLRSRPDTLLGGSMVTPKATGAGACATQAIMDFVYQEQESRDGLRLFSTSNLAIATDAFHQIGGFATEFGRAGGEDYDLCARWQEAGGAAEYVSGSDDRPRTPGDAWRLRSPALTTTVAGCSACGDD
jgi:cellulose synthase/poly-beta-1,6-N-acetylglucosamine synthase-like glycosyltransferase